MKELNVNAGSNINDIQPESSSDSKLKEISRDWTPAQWEEYLVTLEGPGKEDLIHPDRYDRLRERAEYGVFDLAQTKASPELNKRIRTLVKQLTGRQQEVIELIFFRSKSSREVSLALGIAQSTVRDLKRKAIKNIRRMIVGGTLTFPLVKGREKHTEESNA